MEYKYDFYFDEENYCFYPELGNKELTFKDLFTQNKDAKTTWIENNIYYITIGTYIYPLDNPGDVKFSFPDKTEKNVFISSYKQIKKILMKYKSYDLYYSKDNDKNYKIFNFEEIQKIYPVKEVKIINKQFKEIYSLQNMVLTDYSKLIPKNLSLSYEKYLKNSIYIEEDSNFFNYTKERESFFKQLDSELIKKEVFLPICGPEGIGKTSSILAYCRMKIKHDYFYYNVRAFAELLIKNSREEINQLLIKELSNFLNSDELNDSIEKINEFKSYNCTPIDFLINILETVDNPKVLIIDQYKTAYDENYIRLQDLLNKYQSSLKIILLSSMNEDDVKTSVNKVIKKEKLSKTNFFLDYLYVGKLAVVADNIRNSLNKSELEVLDLFGNLYSTLYEIIDFKKKNEGKFIKEKFLQKKQERLKNDLLTYFKSEDTSNLYNILDELFGMELSKLTKEKFLKEYTYIPFRYIQLSTSKLNQEKFIFKLSEVDDNTEYKFYYLFNYFVYIINNLIGELSKTINKNKTLLAGVKTGIEPHNFENRVFKHIWGFKKFNEERLNHKIKVSSIYNLSNEDIKKIEIIVKEVKAGEGVIIEQENSNAAFFDAGIFVKIKENAWKLYLIQTTKGKTADERLTKTFLNDIFGFIKEFLLKKCNINIIKNYFCYIFDEESKDNSTIEYCKKENLDYIFYNSSESKLNKENKYLNEYKMKQKLFESNKKDLFYKKDFEIKKYYPNTNASFEDTKEFLNKKRKIIKNKEYLTQKGLIERIRNKEKYYSAIKENFEKVKEIDYNEREEEINNYLVDTDFKYKDLVGIKISVPDQNYYKNALNDLGLKDNIINNFFEVIQKDKSNFLYLNIEKIDLFIPSIFIPEYLSYIIIKTDNKIYYLDYENKRAVDLSNKNIKDFIGVYNEQWEYISITLINKNLAGGIEPGVFQVIKPKKHK